MNYNYNYIWRIKHQLFCKLECSTQILHVSSAIGIYFLKPKKLIFKRTVQNSNSLFCAESRLPESEKPLEQFLNQELENCVRVRAAYFLLLYRSLKEHWTHHKQLMPATRVAFLSNPRNSPISIYQLMSGFPGRFVNCCLYFALPVLPVRRGWREAFGLCTEKSRYRKIKPRLPA